MAAVVVRVPSADMRAVGMSINPFTPKSDANNGFARPTHAIANNILDIKPVKPGKITKKKKGHTKCPLHEINFNVYLGTRYL